MADTPDGPQQNTKPDRFAGRLEDLPIEDLEFLASIDQRNDQPSPASSDVDDFGKKLVARRGSVARGILNGD